MSVILTIDTVTGEAPFFFSLWEDPLFYGSPYFVTRPLQVALLGSLLRSHCPIALFVSRFPRQSLSSRSLNTLSFQPATQGVIAVVFILFCVPSFLYFFLFFCCCCKILCRTIVPTPELASPAPAYQEK